MKTTLLTLSAICLCMGLAGCASTQSASNNTSANHTTTFTSTSNSSSTSSSTPSWLFSITSAHGSFKKSATQKGVYVLDMPIKHMNQVLMFSDRPNRIVKSITPSQLKNIWTIGPNSFQNSPPNAVLVAQGLKPRIVTVKTIKTATDNIAYEVESTTSNAAYLTPDIPSNLKDVTLMVDCTAASPWNQNPSDACSCNGSSICSFG